ncbi:MAG: hypothetical protein R3D26_22625 [Cyanobacteriota/Melainabacteria group bacterium]
MAGNRTDRRTDEQTKQITRRKRKRKKANLKKGNLKPPALDPDSDERIRSYPQQAMGAKMMGYAAGVDAYRAKNYQQALTLFYDALKANPRDESPIITPPCVPINWGRLKKAITLYKESYRR